MKYSNYRYIYPPRPKNAIPSSDLNSYDNGTMLAQPKLDGSNCLIFTDGKIVKVMNRHSQPITRFEIPTEEILSLYKGSGGWTVINGEYMNKSKRDETGNTFNHKFVIFDILVNDGDYLIGKTFDQRVKILDEMFDTIESEKQYLYSISANVFRVKTYTERLLDNFERLVRIDMVEGLVMKRKNARLEIGNTELNNVNSQLKSRKPTKNYKY
jgi:ATP-dependent DNA ligase